ncbi:MAG: YHYH protein [Vicinamibacterales bacterium]
MRHHTLPAALVAATALAVACNSTTGLAELNPVAPTTIASTSPGASPTAGATSLPGWYAAFGNGVTVALDGDEVVLRTPDVPDHPSPYFGTGSAMYEAPGAGMQVNPNRIATQDITLRVPASPAIGSATDTPMGPIGVAVNGVVFFNQYAAQRQPLTAEIRTFDRFNGHPAPGDLYHYHVEPLWLTAAGKDRLVGVLLDGFPVYGPEDAGAGAPADLDVCHGHVRATPEFPEGIYHYHTTSEPPYISGCFRGSRGSVG